MKKVLILKSVLLPYSETFIKEQVSAYSRWRSVMVGLRRDPGLPLDGLDVRLLHVNKGVFRICRALDVAPPGCVQQLARESTSLIHAHFGNEGVMFWPIVRRLNVPLVVTLHGSDINIRRDWQERQGALLDRAYPRRLLKMSRDPRVSFIAVSDAIRQQAIAFGLPEEKVKVLYIGVDTSKFSHSRSPMSVRKRQVLFVGRMVEKKGCRYLIEAFAQVRKQAPDAELVMIGDGPLLGSLKELSRTFDVPVLFFGSASSAEVKRHLDQSRVFCLPSIVAENGDAEGLPIVILEAQACGVPVVTSARGGATEGIIHGQTGFAFDEKDVGALANHLLRLLQDDDLAESMSRAGPPFIAERFDIRKCTAALEDYYDALVDRTIGSTERAAKSCVTSRFLMR